MLRRCQMCGITPKGATSERACTSPSGVVHFRTLSGVTFCGKHPRDTWTLGPAGEDCDHPRDQWKFIRTREDWYDGDEEDIYECQVCGKSITEYIPR